MIGEICFGKPFIRSSPETESRPTRFRMTKTYGRNNFLKIPDWFRLQETRQRPRTFFTTLYFRFQTGHIKSWVRFSCRVAIPLILLKPLQDKTVRIQIPVQCSSRQHTFSVSFSKFIILFELLLEWLIVLKQTSSLHTSFALQTTPKQKRVTHRKCISHAARRQKVQPRTIVCRETNHFVASEWLSFVPNSNK